MAASPLHDAVLAALTVAASVAVLVVVNLAVAHLWARHVARQVLGPEPDNMGEVRPRSVPWSDSDGSDRVRSAGGADARYAGVREDLIEEGRKSWP